MTTTIAATHAVTAAADLRREALGAAIGAVGALEARHPAATAAWREVAAVAAEAARLESDADEAAYHAAAGPA